MKKVFWALLIVVSVVAAIAVTMLNPDPMPIDFFFFKAEIPTSLAILGSVFVGTVLGWMVGVVPAFGKGRQLKKAQKKLSSTEKELEDLRQAQTPTSGEP